MSYDPNPDLEYIRMVGDLSDDGDADGRDYRRAMDRFQRLDKWLSNGGEGPADWVAASVIAKAKDRAGEGRQ